MNNYKGLFTFDVDNHRYVPVEQADGIIDINYNPKEKENQNLKLYTKQEIINMVFDTFTEMAQQVYDAKGNMDYETFYKISMTIVRFKSSMLEKLGFSEEDINELVNKYKEVKNENNT